MIDMYLGATGSVISSILGWLYFLAWSISFYPQVYLDWKRKSVVGLSFDYPTYNIIGFVCYAAFNLSFFTIPSIQLEYERSHNGAENEVTINDVFFAVHAVVLTLVIIFQIFIYDKGDQKLSKICILLSSLIVVTIFIWLFLAIAKVSSWLLFLYFLSGVKVGISFIKYCPQVYLNYKRKSTIGWNIWNVLLDFTGGILSVAQLVFDSWRHGNWAGITGDPAKFALGLLSIGFDVIFMVQHYILYRDSNSVEHENKMKYVQINEEEEENP